MDREPPLVPPPSESESESESESDEDAAATAERFLDIAALLGNLLLLDRPVSLSLSLPLLLLFLLPLSVFLLMRFVILCQVNGRVVNRIVVMHPDGPRAGRGGRVMDLRCTALSLAPLTCLSQHVPDALNPGNGEGKSIRRIVVRNTESEEAEEEDDTARQLVV